MNQNDLIHINVNFWIAGGLLANAFLLMYLVFGRKQSKNKK